MSLVGNFVLRMSDFGGRWSVTLKNRGGQRKLRGGQGQKARAIVCQWVPTFKEAMPPPPPGVYPVTDEGFLLR